MDKHETDLLLDTVRAFMQAEIFPHEEMVDRTGTVPEDLGRQIETRAKAAGLYSANMPERVGGGGLSSPVPSLCQEAGQCSLVPLPSIPHVLGP